MSNNKQLLIYLFTNNQGLRIKDILNIKTQCMYCRVLYFTGCLCPSIVFKGSTNPYPLLMYRSYITIQFERIKPLAIRYKTHHPHIKYHSIVMGRVAVHGTINIYCQIIICF